jgi:hypothetical protein
MFNSYSHFKKATKFALEFIRENPKAKMSDFRNALLQYTEFKNTHSLSKFFDKKQLDLPSIILDLLENNSFIVNHNGEKVCGESNIYNNGKFSIQYNIYEDNEYEEYYFIFEFEDLNQVKKEDDGSYTFIYENEEEVNIIFYQTIS